MYQCINCTTNLLELHTINPKPGKLDTPRLKMPQITEPSHSAISHHDTAKYFLYTCISTRTEVRKHLHNGVTCTHTSNY